MNMVLRNVLSGRVVFFWAVCTVIFGCFGGSVDAGVGAEDREAKRPNTVVMAHQADELLGRCLRSEALPAVLTFHLRTYEIGSQMFVKRRRKKTRPETLVFSMPAEKGAGKATISTIVYRWSGKRERGLLGFEIVFPCSNKQMSRLTELYQLRLLDAFVRLEGIKVQKITGQRGVPSFSLNAANGHVRFACEEKDVFKTPCEVTGFKSFAVAESKLAGKTPPLTMKLELEDLPNIRYFFDWEPDQPTWYAREHNRARNRGIVVWQERAANRVWRTKLPNTIPAGRYNVLVDAIKVRHRKRPVRLKITLNGCERTFLWHYPSGWKYGPIFETSRDGNELIIEAIRAGGGGVGCHPTYLQQDIILLDSMVITTDLNVKKGG